MWKKWLKISLWCLLGCGCITLLVAAVHVKNGKTISDIVIDIDNHGEKIFINEKDIAAVLTKNGVVKGVAVENTHPVLVEAELEENAWIRDAQLFFDNNQVLTVKIAERQPIARVFTVDGASFYIDTAGNRLPLSDKFSARLPVFSSYPSIKKQLTAQDSIAVLDVRRMAQYIQQDSFWLAQVGQVDITPQHTYEIIPVLGNQVIKLGNGENLDAKFKRLLAFYKQVWSKAGFEKYETVDVQFDGQVVAAKRGYVAPVADSATAMQRFMAGGTSLTGVNVDSLRGNVPARANASPARDSAQTARRPAAVMPPKRNVPAAARRAESKPPKKQPVRRTTRRH